MNVEDMHRPNGTYDDSRSWPYFQTLDTAALAESDDVQVEPGDEGPDLSWVGPVATTLLALAIGIGIGVWIVPIVRSPPNAAPAASAGPAATDPMAAVETPALPQPAPARPAHKPRQSAVAAAATPSPRKAAPSRLVEAHQDARPPARRAAEKPEPPRAKLPPLWPADAKVAVIAPTPSQPPVENTLPPTTERSINLAAVAAPPQPRHEVRSPTWVRKPTAKEMAKVYEENALRRDLSGSATLSCSVAASGSVRDCRVHAETPAGAGFGHMALELSRYFKVKPETVDGQPVANATVSIPIKFAGRPWRY